MSADPPLWAVASAIAAAAPQGAAPPGTPLRSFTWLASPAVDWLSAPATSNGLRAAVVAIEPGQFEEQLVEAQDSYVLGGEATIDAGGTTFPLSEGTAFAVSAGTHTKWTVTSPLVLFTVYAGQVGPSVATIPPTATTFEDAGLSDYRTDHLRSGAAHREIAWLREGPEGTGGFFSGLFTIQPCTYEKEFVVNEFVLLLEGEKEIDVAGFSYVFRAGHVAAYSKGWICQRSITKPVQQFFAGR